MRSGFIVRPFGRKSFNSTSGSTVELDFDRVESELIRPAFKGAGIDGGTTGDIARAGNIRTDMFELLAVADVVVADISIHNANVFYELGARHALRTQVTILIRCRGQEIPFDLRTDRYIEYDADTPGQAVDKLIRTLKDSLTADNRDSPIFALLPKLDPPLVSMLCPVPREFQEAVRRAADTNDVGQLILLDEEADGRTWAAEGIRLVARELFFQKRWPESLSALNRLRELAAGDSEADMKLATVYVKLKCLADSDNAINRALAHHNLNFSEIAEAYALLASNAKTRWLQDLGDAAIADEESLGFAHLSNASELYRKGFDSDLNHYFSGLNALAMVSILLELGRLHPAWWNDNHDDEKAAGRALDDLDRDRELLLGAVDLSIQRGTQEPKGDDRIWATISRADFLFLSTPQGQDGRVVEAYKKALTNAPAFAYETVSRQLDLYAKLGVFSERVTALRTKIQPLKPPLAEKPRPIHWIVFAGHRVDAPGRSHPRFPATLAAQSAARAAIEAKLTTLLATYPDSDFCGLCGAANGGDILFHEVCRSLNIPVWLYLAIPENDYIERSVRHEDQSDWVPRFRTVVEYCNERTRRLADDANVPIWLNGVQDDYVWERNNRWLLNAALAEGARKLHLLVLWDGKMEGDGSGGTHHMVQVAKASGADIIHISTCDLFGI